MSEKQECTTSESSKFTSSIYRIVKYQKTIFLAGFHKKATHCNIYFIKNSMVSLLSEQYIDDSFVEGSNVF